ncbi:hypothetical protein H2198_001985 [Neophaeococcomyces mojaviensis]|uniref:Uncharacterized protein n=1 Tax=Neophaeococcomyces mojaviensis TaxID=3383035 RepID=A0ACC3AFH0_9EURO|nr:hypothetical protein H2198_001985 [Knufia sp. JES_112]
MSSSQTLPTSQRALQFTAPTPLTTLHLNRTAPVPPLPTTGIQTLIRIHSTSLNPVDYKLASLPSPLPRLLIGSSPITPGTDFVGRVVSTTHPDLKSGDLVFGKLDAPSKYGTCAEFTVVKGKSGLVKVPEGWENSGMKLEEFAGVGVAALTALMSLRKADLPYNTSNGQETGGKVFINGGSGGVGTFTVQLAKHVFGCHVVASCSGANVDLVKSLGADEVIDYKSKKVLDALNEFRQRNGEFDAVIDLVGADPDIYYQSHHYLKAQEGRFIQIGGGIDLGSVITMAKVALWPGILGGGKRSWMFASLGAAEPKDLDFIGKSMVERKLKCVVDDENVFDLEDGKSAFEKLKSGRTRGKIIIRCGDGS